MKYCIFLQVRMPGAGVVASKVRKQRAAAQSLKDNKEEDGEAKRKNNRGMLSQPNSSSTWVGV